MVGQPLGSPEQLASASLNRSREPLGAIVREHPRPTGQQRASSTGSIAFRAVSNDPARHAAALQDDRRAPARHTGGPRPDQPPASGANLGARTSRGRGTKTKRRRDTTTGRA